MDNGGKVTPKIIKARKCHRRAINRLIVSAKIGKPITGSLKNFLVVKVEEKVVACAAYELIGNGAAVFTHCVVKRAFRHQGIGSALINHRMKICRKTKTRIVAFVTIYYLYNFYKKWGFKTCPRKLLPKAIKNYWMFTVKRYKKCAVMFRYFS